MNSDEGMSMAKMAVAILLVVLVIGAVVALVYAAYSWYSSGSDQLTDNVTSIGDSTLAQYDNQTVSGSDVLSALKNFRNSELSIFIANLQLQKGTDTNYTFNSGQVGVKSCPVYCALPKDVATTTTGGDGSQTTVDPTFDLKAAEVSGVGNVYCIDGFEYETDQITIKRNTNFSPTTTKSNTTAYVRQNAQWYSNLVYDETTGDVAGIVFRQMN